MTDEETYGDLIDLLRESVDEVDSDTLRNIQFEFTFAEFQMACREAYHEDRTEILERADGVTTGVAMEIAEVIETRDRPGQ